MFEAGTNQFSNFTYDAPMSNFNDKHQLIVNLSATDVVMLSQKTVLKKCKRILMLYFLLIFYSRYAVYRYVIIFTHAFEIRHNLSMQLYINMILKCRTLKLLSYLKSDFLIHPRLYSI